jgi:hypothetical protein
LLACLQTQGSTPRAPSQAPARLRGRDAGDGRDDQPHEKTLSHVGSLMLCSAANVERG